MAEAAVTRHVVLVGLMGVGKSTVGRRLAKELERPFVDVDEQVELRAGLAIPALFRRDGEDAFRRVEAEVLADLVGRTDPLVIAAGGGAVNRPENRALLVGRTFVVWLRASPAFVAARVDPTHRPLLAGEPDPVAALARLQAERQPAYAEAADVDVDVEPFHRGDDKPKRALARHIAALVRGEVPPPPSGQRPRAAFSTEPTEPASRPVGPAARTSEPAVPPVGPAARTSEPAAPPVGPAARLPEPAAPPVGPAARLPEPAAPPVGPAAQPTESPAQPVQPAAQTPEPASPLVGPAAQPTESPTQHVESAARMPEPPASSPEAAEAGRA